MRYHITRGGHETTVTIDDILSEMLALRLGHDPDRAAATGAAAFRRRGLDCPADTMISDRD